MTPAKQRPPFTASAEVFIRCLENSPGGPAVEVLDRQKAVAILAAAFQETVDSTLNEIKRMVRKS